MTPAERCPRCGAVVESAADGAARCPACLLAHAAEAGGAVGGGSITAGEAAAGAGSANSDGAAAGGELPTPLAGASAPLGTDRIGPYRLLERIGEGGMGEVWLAEQQAPIRRRVALKLIKPGMGSREVVARFEAERQALALMG
ncbi:MAG TPA: hypothetical protein VMS86_07830, partial [Thermoanaerobaculia bacterium]|nr:hypothetical protein [Thermoanaerobaculia bacterium]